MKKNKTQSNTSPHAYMQNFPIRKIGQIYSWVLIYGTCASYRNGSARNPEMTFWNSNFPYAPDNKAPASGKPEGWETPKRCISRFSPANFHTPNPRSSHYNNDLHEDVCNSRKGRNKARENGCREASHFDSAHQVGLSASICRVVFVAFAFYAVGLFRMPRLVGEYANEVGIEGCMAVEDIRLLGITFVWKEIFEMVFERDW